MLIRSSKVYFLTALSLRSLETPRTQSYYFFFLSANPNGIGPPCGIPHSGSAKRNSMGQAFHGEGRAERKKQHPFGSALVAISAGCSLILYRNVFRRRRKRFAIAVLSTAMAKNFLFAFSAVDYYYFLIGTQGKRLKCIHKAADLAFRLQRRKMTILYTGRIIMYKIYAVKSRSTDHIHIGQSKKREGKVFFPWINSKIPWIRPLWHKFCWYKG